ncbi:type 1 fimbrial protein [Serratia fonticola]|uniref:fimbrial protein n=1 Tax=Serratia fonticola TaxID=47917 RepID=UPI001AE81FA1|nr:fimbrial protein [Serratia fonticola]MBP1038841.1 type 1 fimbrial protein [Serratia fonticola]
MNKMISNKEALLITLLGLSGAANAADGTINFTGEILTQGCTIGSTNPLNVDLGNITFPENNPDVGKESSGRQFSINLINCPSSLSGITFSGAADSTFPDTFAVNGGADGVAIRLYKSDYVTRVRNGVSETTGIFSNSGGSSDNIVTLFAKYVTTKSQINPGPANATVNFNLEY